MRQAKPEIIIDALKRVMRSVPSLKRFLKF